MSSQGRCKKFRYLQHDHEIRCAWPCPWAVVSGVHHSETEPLAWLAWNARLRCLPRCRRSRRLWWTSKAEPAEKVLEVAVVPAPLASLEAFVPEDIGAAEPKLQTLDFRSSWRESSRVNHVVLEEDVETTPQNSGGLGRGVWRVLLGVIAAALGAFGIRFVQMGLGWWDLMSGNTQYNPDGDVTLFLLGVVLLEAAWRALLAAFPKLRAWVPSWSVLKPDRQARQAKQKEREDHLPPPEESRSTAGRILMALLAIPLAIEACLPLHGLLVGAFMNSRCRSRCSRWD